MDPFHVVRLAGDALDDCRRRVQQQLHKRRGRKDDPLYKARRTLHTGMSLLTDRQRERLSMLFAHEKHAAVEASLPLEKVCGIVVHGNGDLSSALIREMLWRRLTVVWCSSRGRSRLLWWCQICGDRWALDQRV